MSQAASARSVTQSGCSFEIDDCKSIKRQKTLCIREPNVDVRLLLCKKLKARLALGAARVRFHVNREQGVLLKNLVLGG